MEIAVNFEFVNWWGVLAATIVTFLLAGVWYAPTVFGRFGLDQAEKDNPHSTGERNIQLIFVIAFLFNWLTASLLSAVLGPNASIRDGVIVGVLIGCFFVATSLGISAIFDRRPVIRMFVNGTFHIVSFSVMGALIGVFNT